MDEKKKYSLSVVLEDGEAPKVILHDTMSLNQIHEAAMAILGMMMEHFAVPRIEVLKATVEHWKRELEKATE